MRAADRWRPHNHTRTSVVTQSLHFFVHIYFEQN